MSKKIFLKSVFLILLVAFLSLNYVSAFDWGKSIAYWDCDESSGDLIDSVGGYNGTAIGTPENIEGILNNATYNKNTTSGWEWGDLSVPEHFNLTNQDWTINFWFNSSTPNSTTNSYMSSTLGDGFYIFTTTGKMRIAIAGEYDYNDNFYPQPNQTYMWTLVQNSSNTSAKNVYVNGVYNQTLTNTGEFDLKAMMEATLVSENNLAFMIGADGISNPERLWMDEIGFFNDSLTSSEITELYNSGNSLDYGYATPEITIISPLGYEAYVDTSTIVFNISVTSTPSVDSCWYTLNNGTKNYTMNNDSSTSFYHTNSSISSGKYLIFYYCNNSDGYSSEENVTFGVASLEGDFVSFFDISAIGNINPNGITTNGTDIWTGDRFNDVIYRWNMSGSQLDNFSVQTEMGGGTTVYGLYTNNSNIWAVYQAGDLVVMYNMTGGYVSNFSISEMTDATGITGNGSDLWIADTTTGNISRYLINGTYVENWSLNSVQTTSTGLATDNTNIWVFETGALGNRTYKYDMSGNYINNWSYGDYANSIDGATRYVINDIDYFFGVSDTDKGVYRILGNSITPNITITSPTNHTNSTNTNLFINYTVSDINLDSCWYSNDSYASNTSLASCANITSVTWTEGYHNVTIWANDTSNNVNQSSVTFTIDTTPPNISIIYPSNTTYINNLTNGTLFELNWSVNDTLSTYCWYEFNNTNTSVTCSDNNTFIDINNTHYLDLGNLTFYANDSVNNLNKSSIFLNFSLINSTINSPTTESSLTFDVNITFQSESGLSYCYFNITTLGGASEVVNTAIPNCNTSVSTSVTSDGTYMLNYWVNTTYNIMKKGNATFSVSTGGGYIPPSGGGGGGTPIETELPVIALQDIISSTRYTDLEKAIIYSTINSYCSQKISRETLVVSDYSDSCTLAVGDMPILVRNLNAKYSVQSSVDDMKKFYENYKDGKYIQFYATEKEILRYNLFTSVLGITNPLKLIPSSINKPQVIVNSPEKDFDFVFKVSSNKLMDECSILEGENINCTVENSTIIIRYHLNDTDFFNKVFTGLVNVGTKTDDPNKLESKRINLSFSVYNFGADIGGIPIIIVYPSIIILIIIVLVLIFRTIPKNKKKKILESFKP